MKSIILILPVIVFSFPCYSQDLIRSDTVVFEKAPVDTVLNESAATAGNTQNQKASKYYYGGYVNLMFGSYTVIGIEPMLAYKITPKFSVGTKLTYEYFRDKQGSSVYSESDYGYSLFTRLRLTQNLYAHTEYSSVNYRFYNDQGGSGRNWVPFLFVGGGFSQPVSKNTWLNAELLFDVLQNKNSPYKKWEPFYSVGFGVGF